ncbi:MAG: outer membrane beta-barrel protein [Muribaculaceae bacterium]|nr:outer membrane beta-barrel protein [Muribaculaceae bacterium]
MKKITLFLILVSLFATLDMAAQWRYGIRVGGEFSRPTYAKDQGHTINGGSGFAGGLTLEWQLPKSGFALGTAVLYERRNINEVLEKETVLKYGGDFIAIPLDIKYKFPLNFLRQLAAFMVITGPDFGIRLNKDDTSRRFHFGWNVGGGIDVVNFVQIIGGYRFGINDVSYGGLKLKDSGGYIGAIIQFAM